MKEGSTCQGVYLCRIKALASMADCMFSMFCHNGPRHLTARMNLSYMGIRLNELIREISPKKGIMAVNSCVRDNLYDVSGLSR